MNFAFPTHNLGAEFLVPCSGKKEYNMKQKYLVT